MPKSRRRQKRPVARHRADRRPVRTQRARCRTRYRQTAATKRMQASPPRSTQVSPRWAPRPPTERLRGRPSKRLPLPARSRRPLVDRASPAAMLHCSRKREGEWSVRHHAARQRCSTARLRLAPRQLALRTAFRPSARRRSAKSMQRPYRRAPCRLPARRPAPMSAARSRRLCRSRLRRRAPAPPSCRSTYRRPQPAAQRNLPTARVRSARLPTGRTRWRLPKRPAWPRSAALHRPHAAWTHGRRSCDSWMRRTRLLRACHRRCRSWTRPEPARHRQTRAVRSARCRRVRLRPCRARWQARPSARRRPSPSMSRHPMRPTAQAPTPGQQRPRPRLRRQRQSLPLHSPSRAQHRPTQRRQPASPTARCWLRSSAAFHARSEPA